MGRLQDRLLSRFLLLASVLFLVVSCEASSGTVDQTAVGWQGTTVEQGDTLLVRTTGGSVWGGDGRLAEEVAIGTETRGENDLLGTVAGIDATADRIFIADYVLVTVRVYDMAGNHVVDIGRHGGGPGEFYSVGDMAIDRRRGELVVCQTSGVLHRLTLSGEYRGTLRPRLQGAHSGGAEPHIRITRAGETLLNHSFLQYNPGGSPPMRLAWALLTVDSAGTLTDTLDIPRHSNDLYTLKVTVERDGTYHPEPVPFGPHEYWNVTYDGALIRGNSSSYRFEIRYPGDRTTVIERDVEPVPVLRQERDAAERRVFGIMRGFQPGWVWDGPEIPETKAFYSGIVPDLSGRIWVLREGEGRPVEGWEEPHDWKEWERNPAWVSERWFEIFEEATGRYLGRVDVPEGFVEEPEPFIDGDTFICLTEDEVGRPIVRRYRLILPEEGEKEYLE